MMRLLSKYGYQDLIFQLIRFSITGATATLTHFLVVVAFVELLHLHPLTANIFGFLSGFTISFSGHRFWTFSGTSRTLRGSLPRFFLTAAINFSLNQSLYYLLLTKLHLHYIPALILVLGLSSLATYSLSRWWVFR